MPGDVTVTLSGFVATTPTLFRSQSGNDFTSFRIAQTRRYLDRERGEWVDGRTLWFTVKVWKNTARNVALSLHKGDPVVVTGRLSLDEWDGPDGPRTSLVVEATALGPDLTLGEARFTRTVHRRDDDATRRTEGGPADAVDGVPAGTLDPTGVPDAAGGGEAGAGPGDGGGEPVAGEPVPGEPALDEPPADDPWATADVAAALGREAGVAGPADAPGVVDAAPAAGEPGVALVGDGPRGTDSPAGARAPRARTARKGSATAAA
ncbi:single-stranded DNA-binding protein [Cellulosimicrobium cellulans]|uniref:single-stranded DNA-binding protein n=1 Tax=Cellulosimicrobium cellulans TaxID=1710 RepID=UPI001883C9F9|nr:single-stranded DNA-binding protein [Cellulosimicrobium cellulans]MBE9926855.1 single-stranded DNA-binding protein [Cellulosimicrobium cellulans]